MIKPLGNICLVKPLEKKKSNILLPDDLDDTMPDRGEVVAIGSKVVNVKVGDRVIFDRVRVSNFMDRVGKSEYLFVPEDLIKAIWK